MTHQLKERIRQSMLELFNSKGFPDMTREAMVAELRNLWNKLDQDGLLSELRGFTFEHFSSIAMTEKRNADIRDQINDHFGWKP